MCMRMRMYMYPYANYRTPYFTCTCSTTTCCMQRRHICSGSRVSSRGRPMCVRCTARLSRSRGRSPGSAAWGEQSPRCPRSRRCARWGRQARCGCEARRRGGHCCVASAVDTRRRPSAAPRSFVPAGPRVSCALLSRAPRRGRPGGRVAPCTNPNKTKGL